MSDNTFTIKEASRMLDCSTQNIYQQKGKLIQLGYMEQSNTGSYVLNEKGINYLQEKRAETIKANNQDFNQVGNGNFTNIANPTTTNNAELVDLLKEQIQELKTEKDYWRNEYAKKDTELQAKNEYIQGLNTQVFALLGTQEQNKQHQEQDVKKGFWNKLFDK